MMWPQKKCGGTDTQSRLQVPTRIKMENPTENTRVEVEGQEEAAQWNQLWKSEAIPMLKSFLCRATNRALPVHAELLRRGVQVTERCPFSEGRETVSHAIFKCEWARQTRFSRMGLRWEEQEDT